jgi:hypothetical protein
MYGGSHRLGQVTQYLPKFLNLMLEVSQADEKYDQHYVRQDKECMVDSGVVNMHWLQQWIFE